MATLEKQKALEFIKPKIPALKTRIINILETTPKGLTSKELCLAMRAKLNSVVGRLDELQDVGLVYCQGNYWRTETRYILEKNPELQNRRALIRSEEKFFRDLRKWKVRYSDVLSEGTFKSIREEAEKGFANRKTI